MFHRRWVVSLVLLAGAALIAAPDSRLRLHGWLQGESFYQGRPASNWARQAEACEVLFVNHQIGKGEPHWDVWNNWVSRPASRWEQLFHLPAVPQKARPDVPLQEGDPAALPVLIELLGHEESIVRCAAADGIAQIGPPARHIFPLLLDRTKDPNWAVRILALKAMYCIDPVRAQEADVKLSPAPIICCELLPNTAENLKLRGDE